MQEDNYQLYKATSIYGNGTQTDGQFYFSPIQPSKTNAFLQIMMEQHGNSTKFGYSREMVLWNRKSTTAALLLGSPGIELKESTTAEEFTGETSALNVKTLTQS